MHPLVQQYLANEKNRLLRELGLYEKEYSDYYSEEYNQYDMIQGVPKFYKKRAIEVSDSEYEEILKCQQIKNSINNKTVATKNKVATTFKVIAIVIFAIGFIVGIVIGAVTELFTTTLLYWVICFISGMIFLGFAEVIKLLNDIKNK